MNKLQLAISGETVEVSYEELFTYTVSNEFVFVSEADLITWCTFYGLQYTFANEVYVISKL